ncbi:hypothetical protein CCACVL1_03534 [Corchorus capsularis]|uniref:Uncharacterized protein n=1 Tax=Corchorus capsularis TaxID=210143 RepID=A0A1R3JYM3_COCAP|nr:hypothetical protein CCACVL1_03534 [Corchorus capsularis]
MGHRVGENFGRESIPKPPDPFLLSPSPQIYPSFCLKPSPIL